MKVDAQIAGESHSIELQLEGEAMKLVVDEREYTGVVRSPEPGVYTFVVDNRIVEVTTSSGASRDSMHVQIGARGCDVLVIDRKHRHPGAQSSEHGPQSLVAPMPGKVVALLASVGDDVEAGTGVVVVEAMKMQNDVKATKAGVVIEVRVNLGETVAAGQVLAIIE